jgi:hypothetical protein
VSRLRRLRSFWRSYLRPGTRRGTGFRKLSAYTVTREHGTRTPVMGTSADYSSGYQLGLLLGESYGRILQARENSYTAPGSSGIVMADRGGSGEPRESAGSGNPLVNYGPNPSGTWKEGVSEAGRRRESAGSDE